MTPRGPGGLGAPALEVGLQAPPQLLLHRLQPVGVLARPGGHNPSVTTGYHRLTLHQLTLQWLTSDLWEGVGGFLLSVDSSRSRTCWAASSSQLRPEPQTRTDQ